VIKRLRKTGIATKMTAAFVIIIAIFAAEIMYSNWSEAEIDRMHRYNYEFIVTRTRYVLEFRYEFTEMRRLVRESFMNPVWMDANIENFATWRYFEDRLTASFRRVYFLADSYMDSVFRDEHLSYDDKWLRVELIEEAIALVEDSYNYIVHNFFIGGDQSFNLGDIVDNSAQVDELLVEMQDLAYAASAATIYSIDLRRQQTSTTSLIFLIISLLVAATLGALMVRSFRASIKEAGKRVAAVAEGDFEGAGDAGASDEMSGIVSSLVTVFTNLINEISNVADQVKNDDSQARIDTAKFKGGYQDAALAINNLIDTVFEQQAENERMMFMFDNMPIITTFFDQNNKIWDASEEVVRRFAIDDKKEYMDNFLKFAPTHQPCGTLSSVKADELIKQAFLDGTSRFEWLHADSNGKLIPCEVEAIATIYKGEKALVTYTRDVSDIKESKAREEEASERIRMMFDTTPMIIEFWDTDFNCIDSNPYAVQLYGVKSKEDFERFPYELMPEYQPCGTPSAVFWKERLTEILENGHTTYECVCKKADGTPVYTDVVGQRMIINSQVVLVTYSADITRVVLSRQEAESAMERTRLMFNNTPILIEFWNRKNEIMDHNPYAIELFKLNEDDDYIELYDEFLPRVQPDGTPSWTYWVRHLREVFEKGHDRFVMNLVDRQGRDIYTEVVGIRMQLNNEMVAVTYSNDVTQIKQSMERMKAAEERTKLMLDGTPVACYLINKELEAIDCNHAAVTLFDFEDKYEALMYSRDIIMRNNVDKLRQHFVDAFEGGYKEFEWEFTKNDGTIVPCNVYLARFSLDNSEIVAAYLQDMTIIKEMMEQKEKMQIAEENSQAKSKFLASVSHEIRTPITAVLGISEIQMQNPNLPIDVEEAFAKIYDSAGILLNIINDILDISRIEAGKMDIISARYEVSSVAIDTVQLHLVYLGSKRIKFVVDADENMPAYLTGDELRIKQVLNNVLSNAFKYTDVGTVTLRMYCEYLDDNHEVGADINLVISVIDTGKGMTESQLTALQDEYTRFHEKEDRFTQGTGLGMPIVYNLINLMNGSIEVESQVGVGTTVTIRLPQQIAGEEKLGIETVENLRKFESGIFASSKKMTFTPEPMPYGRVLIVDDVETNIYVAKGLMSFYDLQIEAVNGGYPAIEKVKEGEVYDIIFMDHMMPDINGMETTKILRGLGYDAPIVALTANALIGQAEEFLKNGFDGFVSKPIQTVHLNSVLNKFIRDKQPPEVLEAARSGSTLSESVISESGGIDDYYSRPDVYDAVRKEFLRTQKNVMEEVESFIAEGDFGTARRLVHTLKGMAGLLQESELLNLSGEAEAILENKNIPVLDALAAKTAEILEKLEQQYGGAGDALDWSGLDTAEIKTLFDTIATLLEQDDSEVMEKIEELSKIPGTQEILEQIENYDYDIALETLVALREKMEI